MYAHVIPLTRIPKPAQAFTYRIPEDLMASLRIGHIVRIPWRKGECFGIVHRLSKTSDFPKVSTITSLQEPDPSWSKERLNVLTELADLFHVSWSLMALTFSPDIPKKQRQTIKARAPIHKPDFSISKAAIDPVLSFARSLKSTVITYKFRQHGERWLLYRELCATTHKSLLFLAPQTEDAAELYAYLSSYYPDETCFWDRQAAKNEQWESWQRVKTSRIVISTRSGVFLPVANLGWIIIDQDDQPEHKQWEAAPHYDARDSARRLAETSGAGLLKTAAVPRIETTDPRDYQQSQAPLIPVQTVIHSGKELLHPDIVDPLQATIANGKSCLVICTHKGGHRLLRCLDCQHRWICPTCKVALYQYETGLRCPLCRQETALPQECPACHSQNIRLFGAGSQKVRSFLQPLINAPMYLWHRDQVDKPDQSQPHIIISTPYACKPYLRDERYQTLLLFHPESLLFQADYRASEFYYHLIQWHRLCFSGTSRRLFVQSKIGVENDLYTQVIQDDYKAFFNAEQNLRRPLLYPPHASILKFILRSQDENEIKAVHNRLRKQFRLLRGPYHQEKPAATYWMTKVTDLSQAKLDNPMDSIYNKMVIDVNPHHL